jgi:hypothetical protein
MKIKIHLKSIGVCATVTYLPGDGELIFNDDKKSGIIRNKYGDNSFEVIEN